MRPSATAASTRFWSAFVSAALSFAGSMPSCFAASLMTAWLSSFGDVSLPAANAPPAPTRSSPAATPITTLRFAFMSMLEANQIPLRAA